MIRRPLFPGLMALSFKFFGVSVESGFFIVRAFFVLNVILCYFLGKKLFNKAVGITFALLVLTSFQVNIWSSKLLLDNIITFFLFLYLLFVYLSFQTGKKRYFVLSGVILSVALLTKGVFAFWFIFLPLVLFVYKQNRNKSNFKGTILLYIVFIGVLSPWIQRILTGEIHLTILLGPLADFDKLQNRGFLEWGNKQNTITFSAVWEKIVLKIYLFKIFYIKYLGRLFILDKLFCLGLGYSLYQSIWKKTRSHGLLIFSFIFFSPIIYIAVRAEGISFRHGQMMFLWFLLYLMLSAMVFDGCKILGGLVANRSNLGEKKKLIQNIMVITILLICISLQVFIGTGTGKRNFYQLLDKGNKYFSFYQGEFNTFGDADVSVRNTSKWMNHNISVDSKILCQTQYLQAISFFTNNNYNIIKINNIKSSNLLEKEGVLLNARKKKKAIILEQLGKPLFITPSYKFRKQGMRGQGFSVLFEKLFLEIIIKGNIDYVIVTNRRNYLSLYLMDNPGFEIVKIFGNGKIKIFKIIKSELKEIDGSYPMFHENIYKVFDRLYNDQLPKYIMERKTLEKIIGWNNSKTEKFFSSIKDHNKEKFCEKYGCFKERKIY